MTQERALNRHYSEQTGHWVRGQVNRARQTMEKQFLGGPYMPHDINLNQIIRRKMRRVTRDGRQ